MSRIPESLRWPLLLALPVLLVGVLTMPASLYAGDPFAVRAASANLIEHGELTIPYARRTEIDPVFLANRGLFFFEDDGRQRYASRYRTLNSLLVLPPLLVERVRAGPLRLFHDSPGLVVALNLYYVLISGVIACYLLALASRLTQRKLLALLLVLATLYGTFLWNYLRAQTSEAFQVCFFLGFAHHLFAWAERSEPEDPRRGHFAALVAFGGLLTLLKPYYGLLFPVAWAALQAARPGPDRRRAALSDAAWLGAPAAAFAGLVLLENAVLFGRPLNFAGAEYYDQGVFTHDHFSLRYVPAHLAGFLFQLNRSVFVHAPLLILALFGLRSVWREHRLVLTFSGVSLAVFLLLLSAYSNWTGQWSYGPRYLVFLLPLVCLLAAPALEWCLSPPQRAFGWVAGLAIVVGLALSVRAQVRVNSLDFFAYYRARALFKPGIPEIDRYFDAHFATVNADLLAFKRGEGAFPPFALARQTPGIEPRTVAAAELSLRRSPALRSNFYFARDWWRVP